MKILLLLFIFTSEVFVHNLILAQEEEEINYYQMEPLDDSLFIQIQQELFIDPPDPKAEIIVDIRDVNNQVITVKDNLYPLSALKPATIFKVTSYPFKLNLEESINYGSVFTKVINKIHTERIFNKPTVTQISSKLGFINPYFQLLGGERLGFSLKDDMGISFGFGTPYSGVLETNFIEVNMHILGFRLGSFNSIDALTELKSSNNHNNLFVTRGFQVSYTIPFGNFFEMGYLTATKFTDSEIRKFTLNTMNKDNIVYNADGSIKYQPYLLSGSHINWELRYPIRVSGSTRGKFYAAKFIGEWHIGYLGYELSLAGSVFDFRFDAMISSPVRQPQYVCDIIVQKLFDSWSFSAIAIGPSFILSDTAEGGFGFTSIFFNLRVKVGSSL